MLGSTDAFGIHSNIGENQVRLTHFTAVRAASLVSLSLIAFGAQAATDGTPGATSTGTTDISATSPNLARISNMDDISLGSWDGTTDLAETEDVCVWSNTGAYQITAEGDGAGNAFTLANGANTVAYTVQWDDAATGSASGTALTSGTPLTTQSTSATSTTCGAGANSSLIVGVASSEFESVPAGTYTGTLTLVVAPE